MKIGRSRMDLVSKEILGRGRRVFRGDAIALRHIQEISGHNDLGTLQRYLEVTPEQRKKAVSVIGF